MGEHFLPEADQPDHTPDLQWGNRMDRAHTRSWLMDGLGLPMLITKPTMEYAKEAPSMDARKRKKMYETKLTTQDIGWLGFTISDA